MITLAIRSVPIGAVILGTAAGLLLRSAVPVADPALGRLVLFMVAIKAAVVLIVAVVTAARLRRPGPVWRYAPALTLAAAGPALISGITYATAGAVLFYAGLVLFAVMAWRDRAEWADAVPALRRRSARGTPVQPVSAPVGARTSPGPVGVGP